MTVRETDTKTWTLTARAGQQSFHQRYTQNLNSLDFEHSVSMHYGTPG